VSDPRLALLRDLVSADEECSEALRALDALAEETVSVRARADELSALLALAPAEQDRLAEAVSAADLEAAGRRQALQDAERELAEAEQQGDAERLAAGRRVLVRTKDALAATERRAQSLRLEAEALETRVAAAHRETYELEDRAAALAQSLRGRPGVAAEAGREPSGGLAAVSEWAAGARAALLVARGGVASQRDGVIRQANELASSILGEVVVVASTAVIARRIEAVLRSS
jgi:hypothetical protein